jgi:hypothetical protein
MPDEDITANDARIVQLLSTEHWSVLSSRSLAYNEGFARAGMFLSFLSMSMVALGLLVQGTGFTRQFAIIAAGVMGFDLLIGLTTYMRIAGAGFDDLIALHGMSRIRHAYTQIAPALQPYFTAPINDDIDSVLSAYPSAWGQSTMGQVMYGLSTTLGMVGLIVCAIGGVLAGVIASLLGAAVWVWVVIGVISAILMFGGLVAATFSRISAAQAALPALFPADADPA